MLMSHASTRDFPRNRSSHFKNRLPKPIRFLRRGWQVGMVSLSLPTILVVGEQFVNEKDPLLFMRWHERVYDQDDEGNDRWWGQRCELKILGEVMKDSLSSSTGSQFCQKLVHRYDQERANRTKPRNKWAEDNGVKLYPSFEWTSQGDLLLNTANVDYQKQVARVLVGSNLGTENGMDRRTHLWYVSARTQLMARISVGYHSHPHGCTGC